MFSSDRLRSVAGFYWIVVDSIGFFQISTHFTNRRLQHFGWHFGRICIVRIPMRDSLEGHIAHHRIFLDESRI
jgi:hypothetical protein